MRSGVNYDKKRVPPAGDAKGTILVLLYNMHFYVALERKDR
jgi:hypothetical protein